MIIINKLKHTLKKLRPTIIAISFPALFEILHCFGGEWIINGKFNATTTNVFAIIIIILYISLISYFGYKDYSDNINIDNLKRHLQNNEITFNGVQNLIKYRYNDIVKKTNDIANKSDYSKGPLDIFDTATSICKQVYMTLSDIFYEHKNNITVNMYSKIREGDDFYCRMIAHEGTTSRPKIYLKNLPLDNKRSSKKYLCQKILIENNPQYRMLLTPDQVAKNFTLNPGSAVQYSQYIGIPLTDISNVTVALLEINILNNTIIFNSADECMDLIRKNLDPFVSMFMLSLSLDNLLEVMDNDSNKIKEEKLNV